MKNLPLNLFQVGNTFYSQRINGGLYVFAGREMKELIPRKAFGDSDVLAGLPYDDAVLMFTRNQGGFLYRDGGRKNGKLNVMIYSGSIPLIVR